MKHFEEKIGQLAVINFLQTTQGGDSLNMLMKHPVGPSIWLEIHTGKVKTRELPFCGKITIIFTQRFSIFIFIFFKVNSVKMGKSWNIKPLPIIRI